MNDSLTDIRYKLTEFEEDRSRSHNIRIDGIA